MPFTIEIPVQFRDLDCMGHVNNAVYISYMEQARVEWCNRFPELDFRNPENRTGKSFILARVSCDYKLPVNMGETVTVGITIPRIGNSSFDIAYTLRLKSTNAIVAEGTSVQVYYDYTTNKSMPLTEGLRRLLQQ